LCQQVLMLFKHFQEYQNQCVQIHGYCLLNL
jgi:hypothetical protein